MAFLRFLFIFSLLATITRSAVIMKAPRQASEHAFTVHRKSLSYEVGTTNRSTKSLQLLLLSRFRRRPGKRQFHGTPRVTWPAADVDVGTAKYLPKVKR